MSDIKRYRETWHDIPHGDYLGLMPLSYCSHEHQSDTEYVKYDDHIEEIERFVAVVKHYVDNPTSKCARQVVISAINYYEKLRGRVVSDEKRFSKEELQNLAKAGDELFLNQHITATDFQAKAEYWEARCDRAEKRIDELEATIDAIVDDEWKDGKLKLGHLACANNATRRNQIKAEGIMEMAEKLRITDEWWVSRRMVEEYADKLEKGDAV